jgi:ADP-ribosylglycohydrolase
MLYGGIAGDVIGSRFEEDAQRRRLRSIPYDFELFTKECSFTDDTVLMTALADTITNKQDLKNTVKKYAFTYPHAGYGGKFVKWCHSHNSMPYNSFGNGSAMRVAAIGYVANSWEECMKEAKYSAMITHDHIEGIKGAQAVAGAIYMARKNNLDKNGIKFFIEDNFGYNLSKDYDEIKKDYKFDVTCQNSVPQAIIAFLVSSSVEDAIRKAVCLGGDTDTMACIAGNIAESYYGDLSKDFESKVKKYLPKEIISVIDDFNLKFCNK